jgi:hypothetical protein
MHGKAVLQLTLALRCARLDAARMLRTSTLLIIVFTVLLLFFFPAAVGSFSAVNGPVTAMRASRMAQTIHSAILAYVRRSISSVPQISAVSTPHPCCFPSSQGPVFPASSATLRC